MPDIFAVHTAAKIKWIKNLMQDQTSDSKWQVLAWYLLNIEKYKIRNKLPHTQSNTSLSPFHKQLLSCWEEVHAVLPNSAEKIYNMYLINISPPLEYTIF